MRRSKLQPPLRTQHAIRRQDILGDLQAIRSAKVVLVRAPAGFGKTTVMLQMLESMTAAGVHTAWLTLDDLDNDLPRFEAYLGEAFARILGAAGEPAEGPAGSPRTGLDQLERIAGFSAPFALFLDDAESIEDGAVLALLREIIASLPPSGQLVIGSRGTPDLGLAKLGALGQLLEIDAQQLRFSPRETSDFLVDRCRLQLAPAEIQRLHKVTEGWAAALTLFSVSLARQEDPSRFISRLAGSNTALVEYLAQDVLNRLNQELRQFMLDTCILEDLSAPACDFLRGRQDSAAILAELERAQLFVIPLDADGRNYRYHSLFAEFLQQELRAKHPERVSVLHGSASSWYAGQDRPIPAIEHALAANDQTAAIDILRTHAAAILRSGRARLLARWLGAIEPGRLAGDRELCVVHLWALFFSHDPQRAFERLEQIEAESKRDASLPAIDGDLLALRPLMLLRMDDLDEGFRLAEENTKRLADRKDFGFSILGNSLATMQVVEGRHDAVRNLLDDASAVAERSGSLVGSIYAACCEGIVDLMHGSLREAAARLRFAERRLETAQSIGNASVNAVASVLYAVACYEMNELDAAEQRLRLHLPAVRDQGFPDHVITGHLALIRILFSRGDIDGAFSLLTDLEYHGRRIGWQRAVATARLERGRLALMQGDSGAAGREIGSADFARIWEQTQRFSLLANDLDDLELARLRLLAHSDAPANALTQLRIAQDRAERANRFRRAYLLGILMAVALRASDQRNAAQEEIHKVLRSTASQGFVRLFVDEGEQVASLLSELKHAAARRNVARQTMEHIDLLLLAFGQAREEGHQAAALGKPGLADTLTRKEFQVLKLLAEGLSNDAMAARLYVSETTVRTHLRNLSAKLGAANRTQVVTIARQFGLIG